ncbi:TPA: ABC transporter ATP-binding protein [Candidatus Poribacteria bacterium]|nr:ABC transporter ATP-binding protein [Candidatus Poribacteria bacterium]
MIPIIEMKNLCKWYNQVMAVNDVTLNLYTGITGLLGPNGAGKTTLIRLIVGLLKPDRGEIKVFGEHIWNNYTLNHRIGYCPDHDAFYEGMTGFQFIVNLAMLNGFTRSEAEDRALDVLRTVNMLDNKDKRIGAYSKGMKQRIKLAQTLLHDPDLILLDEPLSSMDPLGRHDTIELIRQLEQEGKSVIVSSHILHEVEAMTDNIILINNGRILAEGDVHEIRELIDRHPHNVYVNCDKPRLLASILVGYDDVVSTNISKEDSALIVETTKPDEFYSRLPAIILENDIKIENLYSPDDNLQAVFKYLIG